LTARPFDEPSRRTVPHVPTDDPSRTDSMRTRFLLAVAFMAGAVAAAALPAAVVAQATRTTWDGVFTAEQADRGAQIYQGMCASCHGPQLGGIDAAPALNGGSFYANWNGITVGEMANRVKVSMPANLPGVMSRQQVADVLAYIFSRNGMPTGDQELPRQIAYLQAIAFRAQRGG
jgi:mono/diheme cytochrome c family protein